MCITFIPSGIAIIIANVIYFIAEDLEIHMKLINVYGFRANKM